MPRQPQLEFFNSRSSKKLQEHARRAEHGGEIRAGKRKLARPFDRNRPLHLTLRSELARGEWSMLRVKKAEKIQALAHRLARENDVQIYEYANSGSHLHLLLRAKTKMGFQRFLRTFSALVPRIVTGARKGSPIGKTGWQYRRKFWDSLAYTRVVNWGRHFFNGRYYVIRNELESEEYIPYQPRGTKRLRP